MYAETITTPEDMTDEMVASSETLGQNTEPEMDSGSSFSLNKLLAGVLSTISVLLLTILAVTIIIVNVWKARKAKGKSLNPFACHT